MKKLIYVGTLYNRFGTDMMVVSESKEEAKNAILKTYEELYRKYNDTDPREDTNAYGESYLEAAEEDIEIRAMHMNEVDHFG